MRERTWKWLACIGAWTCLSAVLSMMPLRQAAMADALDGTRDMAAQRTSMNLGPYNATLLEGGIGVARPLSAEANVVRAGRPWSMTGWIRWARPLSGRFVVAAVGNSNAPSDGGGAWRGIFMADGELEFAVTPHVTLRSHATLRPGRWYAIAATYDGGFARLYVDGKELAAARAATLAVDPRIELAPAAEPVSNTPAPHFGGSLALFTVMDDSQSAAWIQSFARTEPDFSLVTFDVIGAGWPWQEHVWRGLQEPQDPWTLPHGNSAPSLPVATAAPPVSRALRQQRQYAAPPGIATPGEAAPGVSKPGVSTPGVSKPGVWTIEQWHLAAAPTIDATGEQLSQMSYRERDWYPAVVPGTVLTTLIARGVYPEPDYGLNNLAIPDSLSRQDYWYRSVFDASAELRDHDLTLTFKGINYSAEIWLNGRHLGSIRGAFTRGTFDVTGILQPGESNALAVRISPPPHPGIPHEQSMAAGPGNNAGRWQSTAPHSSHPRVGIGFPGFAIAIPVSGRR